MRKLLPVLLVLFSFLFFVSSSSAISIEFDYSRDGGFFSGNNNSRRSPLEAAASYFERHLTDKLDRITSSGNNHFNASVNRPDTGKFETINNYNVADDTIVVFAGGRKLAPLAVAYGGGWNAAGPNNFLNSIGQRGQSGSTSGGTATDFAPWGGSITFDSSSQWYFDDNITTLENFQGLSDLFSVALHELAHILGFGSSDSWNNLVTGGMFKGATATEINDGNIRLNAGNDHWASGTQSLVDAIAQETSMDPEITTGTRKYFTDLDLAALDDIGWDVDFGAPVPVPGTIFLFASGLLGLLGVCRRQRILIRG